MKTFFRLLKLIKPWRRPYIISAILLLLVTVVNLVAPFLVTRLFGTLTEDFSAASLNTIVYLAIALALTYVLRAVMKGFNMYLAHLASWRLVAAARLKLYEHLQKLTLRFYKDKQTGQLMSNVISDSEMLETLFAHAGPDLVTNVLVFVGVVVILFVINPLLAALTCIPLPILVVAAPKVFAAVRRTFRKSRKDLAEFSGTLQDNISGMREIQIFNQQGRESENIKKKTNVYADSLLHALKYSATFHPAVEFFTSIGAVIVVGVGGWLVLQGQMRVADVVGFILYLGVFYTPVSTLARTLDDFQSALSGAERVLETLDTKPDITDMPGAADVPRLSGEVSFHGVRFAYEPEQPPVLDGISFRVKPGEMLALVGPTGVGKTTVVSLLSRMYDPDEGSITMDGHDIRSITLKSLRDQMSIVLQDVFLFTGTIGENISYGCEGATVEEMIAAAKIAHIHDFIASLPQGYDTLVGERGIRLSGGQKQRLSIARAILRKSPILVLDEATASVDAETEYEIQSAISELAGSRTLIIIAHRLATVRKADQILVFQEGNIIERGNHKELLAQGGLYARLCAMQQITE